MPENSFKPAKDEGATLPRREGGLTAGTAAGPPDAVLDITAETCPMTFVRTRLALDRLAPGGTLLVLLRGVEPRARVPATLLSLGHSILGRGEAPDGTLRLLVRRS